MAGAVHGIGKQGQSTPSAGDGIATRALQRRSEALRRVRGRGIALRSGGMALACKAVRGQSIDRQGHGSG